MHTRSDSPSSGSEEKRRYVRHATAEEKLAARRASNRRSNAKRKLETQERNRRMASRVVELESVLRSLLPHLSGPTATSALSVLGRDRDLAEPVCPPAKKRKGNRKAPSAASASSNRFSQREPEHKNPTASELKQGSVAHLVSMPATMPATPTTSLPAFLAEEGRQPQLSSSARMTSAVPMPVMADPFLFDDHDRDMVGAGGSRYLDIFGLAPQPLIRAASMDFLLPDNPRSSSTFGPSDDLDFLFGSNGTAGGNETDLSDTQRLPPDRWGDEECSWRSSPSSSSSQSPSLSPRAEVESPSTLQQQVRNQFQEFVKQASTYLNYQQEELPENSQFQSNRQRQRQLVQPQQVPLRQQFQVQPRAQQPQPQGQGQSEQFQQAWAQDQSQRTDHPLRTDADQQTRRRRIQQPQSPRSRRAFQMRIIQIQSQRLQPTDKQQTQPRTNHQSRPDHQDLQERQQDLQERQQQQQQQQQQQEQQQSQKQLPQFRQFQQFRQGTEQQQQQQRQQRFQHHEQQIEPRLQQQQLLQLLQSSQLQQPDQQKKKELSQLQSPTQAIAVLLLTTLFAVHLKQRLHLKQCLSTTPAPTHRAFNHLHSYQQLSMTLVY